MINTDEFELLNDRIQFEKGVVAQVFDAPVRVKLAPDGKTVQFTHRNQLFLAQVERPLMHQLGSRLWSTQDFSQINTRWRSLRADQLEQELSALFQRHELVARHYRDAKDMNRIYGFVSTSFVDVNPLDFRQQFIEQIRQNTALSPRSTSFVTSNKGDMMEWFDFDSNGFQTEFKYGLHYARNSGYDAYKVHWGRNILICTNGLTKWKGSVSRWKHTRELALADFIDATINEGVQHQQWLEQRINAARDARLVEDELNELMARLSLSSALKERVRNRLEVEAQVVGENEWAFSQALTWLGSHDRHIMTWSKQQLTNLGTELLETSLTEVLAVESRSTGDGMLGMVLPQRREHVTNLA